ncbi:MAG: hypothetical protein ACU0CI_07035, partial [Shimia sp.]
METAAYRAQAQTIIPKPQLWRFALGLLTVLVVWVAAIAATQLLPSLLVGGAPAEQTLLGRNPLGVVLLLASFAGLAAGGLAAAKWWHGGRPGLWFAGAARDFRLGLTLAAPIIAVLALGSFLVTDADPGVPFRIWLILLPVALILVALQTGAEEIAFRGYLQSALAARFASPVIWMGIPS